ncbi:MAG: AmmeMemoRadiSam system radical SAM enzyme [Phycisphaeraceae bacterium]|nr:AmmeMemoRadiSam system radical SAM enzyme [Phycisphaeraceae bacterium]
MVGSTTAFETRWWHRASDDPSKVVCTLCPRECHIPQGSRGFCFVRANVDGELVLTTYGRSSGFCIDPIEKKPLNHFFPGTPILSLGTAGCNLGCKFCQNWDISKSREMDTLAGQAGPEAIVQAAQQHGCRSIAFTYNDPVIWAEYAIDIARLARQADIKTVAVTAGYMNPDSRREFYQWMDAANVDLKAFTETFYRKLTQTSLQPVLDTLVYLKHETPVWFEITTLLIPGENDHPDETKAMCDWIVEKLGPDVPIHFTAFHPDFKMRDRASTPHDTLITARQIALHRGIRYAYVGNVYDLKRESTYCHQCGTCVIERDWYELGAYELDGNRCRKCGTEIPGVYDASMDPAKQWGRKRQPVRIVDATQYVPLRVDTRREEQAMRDSTATTQPAATVDFTDDQGRRMLAFARQSVAATIRGESPPPPEVMSKELHDAPCFGAFVTLRRGERLRACRGRWGQNGGTGNQPLGTLLADVARDTALGDGRFPVICPQELDRLDMDISVMHSPARLDATGEAMAQAIEVGRDGLVLLHPRGRGLLLPHVATENGWDAPTFLSQLCVKAGLDASLWRTDAQARVMTFQTRLFVDPAPWQEFLFASLSPMRLHMLMQRAQAVVEGQDVPPATGDEALDAARPEELGVHLMAGGDLSASALGAGLSATDLVLRAAQSLRSLAQRKNLGPIAIARMILMDQATRLTATDAPQRHALLAGHVILVEHDAGWTLRWPTRQQADPVDDALAQANLTRRNWQMAFEQNEPKPRLTAFQLMAHDLAHRPGALAKREPARAGQFYPAEPKAVKNMVESLLQSAGETRRQTCRAIMLPHAGWRYCGRTLARTLAHAVVPDTLIILGPKHTAHGANWSVSPHLLWAIPGAEIPIATNLIEQLLGEIPQLRCEPEAHRMEHGVEVLLPFLHHANPAIRVVPMVIGHSNYEQTEVIAAALAKVTAQRDDVLLVISSDMNHFAEAAETERRDRLALDAMTSGDPKALYDVCLRHEISMCGMRPAVAVMRALEHKTPALAPRLIDYSHSGMAGGDQDSVVGYAGVVIP